MKNSVLAILGGSGDLTYRKLLPALYNLEHLNKLDNTFKVVIIARRDYSTEEYINIVKEWVSKYSRKKFVDEIFDRLSEKIHYFKMDISKEDEYKKLNSYFKALNVKKYIYYYAVAPNLFLPITNGLSKYCNTTKAKVIVEKPFGEDIYKASLLNDKLEYTYGKDNVYHIDHYLGKEMIQNILSIRFKNTVFAGIWNKDFIEEVQISACEKLGVGTRAGYYDKSGAVRDMLQNHLLQVMSIVGLETPNGDISEKQLEFLKCIRPVYSVKNQLVMGQYEGYTKENGISEDSKTETFVALKLFVDNARWSGVPFYIRTGKMMNEHETKVRIKFKSQDGEPSNILLIHIQPDEGIYFKFNIKKPGEVASMETVSMDFCQSCILENRINTPEAYERLLYASFIGDRSLFSKWDQIECSWDLINSIMDKYKEEDNTLHIYKQGSNGPDKALEMVDWE